MNRTTSEAATGKLVLDSAGVTGKVQALAQAITKEFGKNIAGLAIVGIQTRGAILARRIVEILQGQAKQEIPVGTLDITLYRDDVHAIADQPEVKETDLPFDIEDRPIVLIDDVLFTG